MYEAVFGPRGVMHLRVDLAGCAGEPPQQNAWRSRAEVVAAFAPAEGHRVGEDGGAVRGRERRFQHHGVVHIPALDLKVTGRMDSEVAASSINQPAEHRAAVETRAAQPVHRTLAAD